jgi:hypothetical protein
MYRFKGFELKSMAKELVYFSKNIYEKYIKEFVTINHDPRYKVSRVEILDHFLEWTKTNDYNPEKNIYCQKSISTFFKQDFIKNIENGTGLILQDVKKMSYDGCFVGMCHKEFPYIGNILPEKVVELTETEIIEKQIKKWINTSNISTLFRKINETDEKKLPINQVKLIMKDINVTLQKNSKTFIHLVFNKNDTDYFFTENTKRILINTFSKV